MQSTDFERTPLQCNVLFYVEAGRERISASRHPLTVTETGDTDTRSQTEIVSCETTMRSIVKFKLGSPGSLDVWWIENKQTKLKQKRIKTSVDISHLSAVLMEGKLCHYSN